MTEPPITAPILVPARTRDVGGFTVGRVLPAPARRHVGPFVFLDHMGPITAPSGQALDIGPHPHIGLSTLTYLFEGEILHRDSLGSVQPIRAGEVNWMTAGRGIVHSERTPPEALASERRMHGLQLWVALPVADEDMAPSFAHHAASELPQLDVRGAEARLVAGTAFGARSPVAVRSETFFVDVEARDAVTLELPDHEERAVYVVHGQARLGEVDVPARTLIVVPSGPAASLTAGAGSRLVMLGGAPLDAPRHIWWNFVSSRSERIEEAARAWKEERFPAVPGDPGPRVPLHDEPHFPRGTRD